MPKAKYTHVAIFLSTHAVKYVPFNKNDLDSMMDMDENLEREILEFMPSRSAKNVFMELGKNYLGYYSDYYTSMPIDKFIEKIGPISGTVILERTTPYTK